MQRGLLVSASLLLAAFGCSDPFFDAGSPQPAPEEVCPASREWLPNTPPVELYKPPPHPASECAFYRASWQNFLIVTQPDADSGEPALKSYATIDDVFKRSVPRKEPHAWLGDVKQAGGRQILIDQNSHPIYYGIHVNDAFKRFVADNDLQTPDAVRDAPSDLFLPGDIVELKSAWQEVPEDDFDVSTYISTRALVSRLYYKDGQVLEDHDNPREIVVRMIALHVAFTLPGHPELIWSTFEHKDAPAPVHPGDNPKLSDPNNLEDTTVVSRDDSILFHGGTRANEGNHGIAESDLKFDADAFSFSGAQTSIYRMFPASKSNTTEPDGAITSLNENVQMLFDGAKGVSDADKRRYYRLVGALWMDKPEYFKNDTTLENDTASPFASKPNFAKDIQENGSDSELSILAGEDRLSSTAMESFTQAPAAFPNCFSCHNTQAVTEKGVPIERDRQGLMLMGPKQINVSHVFSQFLLDEVNAARGP